MQQGLLELCSNFVQVNRDCPKVNHAMEEENVVAADNRAERIQNGFQM